MYILQKDKHIHYKQTHLLAREDVTKDYYRKGSVGGKTILVVGLKGLKAKINWLAVNRQS
jgi:hypothetical protein